MIQDSVIDVLSQHFRYGTFNRKGLYASWRTATYPYLLVVTATLTAAQLKAYFLSLVQTKS